MRKEASLPDPNDHAATARWMTKNNLWGSFATISTLPGLEGEPFANVFSYSEGVSGNNTGDLYFFVSTLDQSMIDISNHNFVSMSLTEYQNGVCEEKQLDAEDPRCARLTLSGSFKNVEKNDEDYELALKEMIEKHPEVANWLAMGTHDWHLMKMDIKNIWLIDFFGGGYNMPVADYYAGNDPSYSKL